MPVLNMVQMPAVSIPMEAMSVAVHEAIELEVMVLSVKVSQSNNRGGGVVTSYPLE